VPAQRERKRFELLADLAETVPVYRVCAGSDVRPDGVADMVEDVLETRPKRDATAAVP
jgi:hypothetical protein